MPLNETFNLTPRSPNFYTSGVGWAILNYIYGGFQGVGNGKWTFESQYSNDRLLFHSAFAGDRTLDYSQWANLIIVPHICFDYDLSAAGANKQLALVFSFEAESDSSLLIFSNGSISPLAAQTLVAGDNQFLMVAETLSRLTLYFIHARNVGSTIGGNWFFKGISGYII